MRLNVYIAQSTGLSRRAADRAIMSGRVQINGRMANVGDQALGNDLVTLDTVAIKPAVKMVTIMLHKPVGYICSRAGQGGQTIYELLPAELHHLKPVGRLDKDSSGVLLLTSDGQLANELTHPKFAKQKIYEIQINKPLKPQDKISIEAGISIDGKYISRLRLSANENHDLKIQNRSWQIAMNQGRNRQIRRTFEALDYKVIKLHRVKFGDFEVGNLAVGSWQSVDSML